MRNLALIKTINNVLTHPSQKTKGLKNHWGLSIGIVLFLLGFIWIFPINTPQLVLFSKGQAITTFAKELNDKGVSQRRQRLLVKRFVNVLPQALEHFAKENKVVVLSDKEVVAGAPNITIKVLETIAKEMLKQNQGNKPHG